MKIFTLSTYEEELYCHCYNMENETWLWVKTEQPHDYKAVEQTLTKQNLQFIQLGSWCSREEYLLWSSDDEPLL